jgi:hypothetical protein
MTGISSNAYGTGYVPTYPSPVAAPAVAANQTAKIWGDPHIDAANGGSYDFQQSGIFSLLQDQGISLNAQMTKTNDVSLDTEAGMTVGDRTLHFTADGKVDIAYADPSNQAPPVNLKDGETLDLGKGSFITRSGDSYTVESPEYKVQVDSNKEYNGTHYMDMQVATKGQGVLADGTAPSGLLGETFSADTTKQTAPLKDASAYQSDQLLTPGDQPSDISLDAAKSIWTVADTNGDGKLDQAEMQTAAQKLQSGTPAEQKMANLMSEMANQGQSLFPDFNSDGGVSFGELSQLAGWDGNTKSIGQSDLDKLQLFRYNSPPVPVSYQAPAPGATPATASGVMPAPGTTPAPASVTMPAPGTNSAPASVTTPAPGTTSAPASVTMPAPGTNSAPASVTTPAPGTTSAPASVTTPAPGTTSNPASVTTPAPGTTSAPASGTTPAPGTTSAPASVTTPAPGATPASTPVTGDVQGSQQSYTSVLLQVMQSLLLLIQQMFSSQQGGGTQVSQ